MTIELLRTAVNRADADEAWALVTVIQVSGSAPRHVGAKMLVDAHGRTIDTIGGGRVELEVTRAAREVAQTGTAVRVRHQLVRDLAMCCGGSMEFYIEPVAPSAAALADALARYATRRAVVLITPLDGSPKRVDELDTARDLETSLRDDEFVEPLRPRNRAVIFGAGHVAQCVGPLAAKVGFDVVICDDNNTEALGIVQGAPWVTSSVESFDLRDVEADLGALGPGDYALIMTRDHAVDQAILEQILPNESLTYLGMIGSRGKIGRFRKRLEAKGIATASRWQRLHAPIGIPIGSETPDEIAVSVVAELIRFRRFGATADGEDAA